MTQILPNFENRQMDFEYFINFALDDQISWEVLEIFLNDHSITLQRSKELNKILLEQLKQLHRKLKYKEEDELNVNDAQDYESVTDISEDNTKSSERLQEPLETFEESIDTEDDHNEIDTESQIDEAFEFAQNESLETEVSNINRGIQCELCEAEFSLRKGYQKHLKMVHGIRDLAIALEKEPNQRIFQCQHCDKMFMTSKAMKTHQRSSHFTGKRSYCLKCPKSYTSLQKLRSHEMNHTSFMNSVLNQMKPRVEQIDSESKNPYKCKKCPKRFISYNTRANHNQIAHQNHDESWYYKCKLCAKRFTTKKGLEYHTNTACKSLK